MHKWLSKILSAKTTIDDTAIGKTQPNQALPAKKQRDFADNAQQAS
jgi:hypothetical protein